MHLALTRAYDTNATQADRDRLEAFPNWRSAKYDFDFTPIHVAVLEDYNFNDKHRPSLLELIEFVDKANNAPPGQKWSSWKKEYQNMSPLFGEIIEAFRQEEVRLRRGGSSEKPFLKMIDAPDSRQHWSPLNWAAQTGRLDKIKVLVSRLSNPFPVGKMGRNVLHHGAESKQPEVVEFLLSIPPHPIEGWYDTNLRDIWGETPLHVAVYGKSENSLKCVRLLLERRARRDLPRKDDLFVPLHLACWAHEEVKLRFVDLLTADKGSHINARDNHGRTPIFGFLDNIECIQMLLDRGTDISVYDNNRMTVLHTACIENRIDTLKVILDGSGHALATLTDNDGDTPLAKAIQCKSVDCAKLLLKASAIGDLNGKDGFTLIHRAIEMGDADFLQDCFEHLTYKKGVKTHDGMTVMEFAGRKEKFDGKIKELILVHTFAAALIGFRKGSSQRARWAGISFLSSVNSLFFDLVDH